MDAEAQKEINELKAVLFQVANALRQLQMYTKGAQPTQEGLKLLDDYLNQIDRVLTPGAIRGLGRP